MDRLRSLLRNHGTAVGWSLGLLVAVFGVFMRGENTREKVTGDTIVKRVENEADLGKLIRNATPAERAALRALFRGPPGPQGRAGKDGKSGRIVVTRVIVIRRNLQPVVIERRVMIPPPVHRPPNPPKPPAPQVPKVPGKPKPPKLPKIITDPSLPRLGDLLAPLQCLGGKHKKTRCSTPR